MSEPGTSTIGASLQSMKYWFSAALEPTHTPLLLVLDEVVADHVAVGAVRPHPVTGRTRVFTAVLVQEDRAGRVAHDEVVADDVAREPSTAMPSRPVLR